MSPSCKTVVVVLSVSGGGGEISFLFFLFALNSFGPFLRLGATSSSSGGNMMLVIRLTEGGNPNFIFLFFLDLVGVGVGGSTGFCAK